MPFEIPRSRLNVRQITPTKRRIPVEEIIAIQGRSPIAAGIETTGNVLGDYLTKRAELKKQGDQLAKAEALAQVPTGTFSGVDPSLANAYTLISAKENFERKEKERELEKKIIKVRSLEKQFGYKGGELGDDYDAARLKVQADESSKRQEKSLERLFMGADTVRREGLVKGALASTKEVRNFLTPDTLTEMKAVRLTPGKIYGQLASSSAKQLYANLYNAARNELYLKTGAVATDSETEGQMLKYWPALNDSVDDVKDRMSMLDREIKFFTLQKMEEPSPASIEEPDVRAYADKYKIPYESALQIKRQRQGKR